MNSYYIFGLILTVLAIIFVSLLYIEKRENSESGSEVKENESIVNEIGETKKTITGENMENKEITSEDTGMNSLQLPKGIQINEFGDLSASEDYKGIYIRVSPRDETSRADAKLLVEGIVGIFVNPGAAMATWQEFPENVIFYVKDLSTGKIYESLYLEKSISWDGTPDFGPTNQVVQNTFDKNIFQNGVFSDIESLDDELQPGTSIEIYATFEGMTSNTLKITVE